MNRGIIVNWLCRMFAVIYTWFENSIFRKFQLWFGNLWHKISKNSQLVSFFKKYPDADSVLSTSALYRLLCKVLSLIRKFGCGIFDRIENSYIVEKLLFAIRNYSKVSIRVYGFLGLGFALSFIICEFLFGNAGKIAILFTLIAVLISIISILINKSLSQLFGTSIITKFAKMLFDIEDTRIGECIVGNKKCNIRYLVTGVIFGIVSSVGGIGAQLSVIGLLGLIVLLYNYKIGIFAALILMPFIPTMAVVGLALISFVSMLVRMFADKKTVFVKTPLDVPLAIFIVIMGISAITSFARGNSINIFLVYLSFALSYYTVTNAITTKKQLFAIVIGMLFAGLAVALYGIYQHIFGFAGADAWIDKEMFEDISTRVISTFENPNVLGEYLLLLIPVCCGYIFSRTKAFNKFVTVCITAVLCMCMIYTYSRGNWIGLIVAFALFFMFYDSRIVWLGVIALLFAPVFVPQTIIDRLLSVGDTSDSSTSYRVYIWIGTIAMLKDYWLCGIGLGSEAYNLIYPFYSYSGIVAPHSHNLYLQIITENGIMGIISFIVIIFVYYKAVISTVITTDNKMLKATVTGLAAGMFGYLVQGMFDNVWYNYRIVFMFYIIVALTICAVNISKREKIYD